MTQRPATIARDMARAVRYVSRVGNEFVKKPGRKKLLSAEASAALYQLQIQERAARRQITAILVAAGYTGGTARVLRWNWDDKGRVDVVHQQTAIARRVIG